MEYAGEGSLADIKTRILKRFGSVTLGTNGQATIPFSPPLEAAPKLQLTPWVASGNNPIIANPIVGTLTQDGSGKYTGVTIQGARAQDLPVSVTLVTQLNGRKVTESTSLNGVRVDWMAF